MDKRETGWWTSRLPSREINYNIHVLPERRLIYVVTPKVACSTIKATLWQWQLQDPHVEFKPGQVHNKSISPFKSPGDFGFEEFMLNVNSSEYTRICFVRNPYERLLSCYLDKVKFGARKKEPGVAPDDVSTFADFLTSIASRGWYEADRHWRAQSEQLLWGDIHYDFVGRFESLMVDFNRLSVELGIDLHPYLVVRHGHAKQAHKYLEDFYTGELQARAYELYRSDFEAFGYEYDLPSSDTVESGVENHAQVEVRGWVFEPRNPAQTRRVAVYVDGRFQSEVDANRAGTGLAGSRGAGDGASHGFVWRAPEALAMTEGTRIDVFDADTNRPLCGSPMFVENGARSKGMLASLVKRVEFARSMAVKSDARVEALARELEAARTRHVMALSHRRSRMGIDTLEVGILLRPEWVDEARARQGHERGPLLLLRCNGQVAGQAYAREIEDALVRFAVRRRIPSINDTLYSVHDVATEETLCALVTPPSRRARRILGAVESRPEAYLRGWTLDPDHPLRCGRVAVHVAGRLREVIEADQPRDDIARGRGSGGRHGFLWDIPEDLIANEGERIDVFDADTGLPLRGSPVCLKGAREATGE